MVVQSACPEKSCLTLGFIPLTDCAPLVVAQEKGYFRRYGLEVALVKEPSWANIRDKLAAGVLDGAHMLAPMALATTLGLGGLQKTIIVPMALDLNGNAITISAELHACLMAAGRGGEASALKSFPRLRFASVFPYSSHNYLLCYYLAALGVDPKEVALTVVPPPHCAASLKTGEISGYCVGEPWNQCAVYQRIGQIWVTSYEIWNNHPEKVLGVTEEWARAHPDTLKRLLLALLEAARWLDWPENRLQAARWLSAPAYLDAPFEVVKRSLLGAVQYSPWELPTELPDFHVFYRYGATFPWRSHALWFLTQMVRWGQIGEALNLRQVAETVYRPELYQEAAQALDLPCPGTDAKTEGTHSTPWRLAVPGGSVVMGKDRFCDGRVFNPQDPIGYLAGFAIHHVKVPLEELAAKNS